MKGPRPGTKRQQGATERRRRVLECAIEEFLANGFTAARIEDIAARADVAKGTVYLYCKDKEELFAEAVRNEMMPLARQVHAMLEDGDGPPRQTIERALSMLLRQVTTSRTGDVVRLIMGESLRFPELTAFYRNEVVLPAVLRMAGLLQRAKQDGSLRIPAVADFPHLVIAPILMTVLAKRIAPQLTANPEGMFKAHLDSLFTD